MGARRPPCRSDPEHSDPSIRWQVMRDVLDARSRNGVPERSRVETVGLGAWLLALENEYGQWAGGAYFPIDIDLRGAGGATVPSNSSPPANGSRARRFYRLGLVNGVSALAQNAPSLATWTRRACHLLMSGNPRAARREWSSPWTGPLRAQQEKAIQRILAWRQQPACPTPPGPCRS